jgi:putative hemolysin
MNHAASNETEQAHAPSLSVVGVRSLAPDPPQMVIREGRYLIRFAQTLDEVAAALRLRYEIFNLELGEGLACSHASGRDEDAFDAGCHHLIVIDQKTDQTVGTYRMQTRAMARTNGGFYSQNEFDLADLTEPVLDDSVELGRACVARAHRKQRVLFGLWKGLAAYTIHQRMRYLFGCCSLTSQDAHEARVVSQKLQEDGLVHPELQVRVQAEYQCVDPSSSPLSTRGVKLPTLFGTYLRFGALVCSPPAIDREFRTIDYLVLMDTDTLPAKTRQAFFAD